MINGRNGDERARFEKNLLVYPLVKIAVIHNQCYELVVWYLKFLPKNTLSRYVGQLAAIEEPKLFSKGLRDWFIKKYNINIDEAENALSEYSTLAKLFTRKLKPGVRPIGQSLVHPCDGALTRSEAIESDSIIQAKGQHYKLSDFLKIETDDVIKKFAGGLAITYYLCPTDYHRVHSPIDADIEAIEHVPGELWSVNNWSTENIQNLFAVNERVIFWLRTALGPVAVVMVGATNVGKISVSVGPESFRSSFATNQKGQVGVQSKTFMPAVPVKKGDELGVFNMGSTVIVIYPHKCLNVIPHLGPVKMGASV